MGGYDKGKVKDTGFRMKVAEKRWVNIRYDWVTDDG